MKRICLTIICLLLTLSSCGIASGQGIITNPSKYDFLNNVVEAIFVGDKKSLLDMFAPNAVNESAGLEKDIDLLIFYAQADGIPVSVELEYIGAQESNKKDYDKISEKFSVRYNIKTDSKTFYISIDYCSENTYEEGNVGVTKLIFIDDNDEAAKRQLDKWYSTEVPGVYVPQT